MTEATGAGNARRNVTNRVKRERDAFILNFDPRKGVQQLVKWYTVIRCSTSGVQHNRDAGINSGFPEIFS